MRVGWRAIVGRREVIGAGLGTAFGLAAWRFWPSRSSRLDVREEPLRFRAVPFPDLHRVIDASLMETVRQRLRLRPKMAFSGYLHWLGVFGVPESSEFQAGPTRKVVSLLTDAGQLREHYGRPAAIAVHEDGVCYLPGRIGDTEVDESRPLHASQETAVFGSIGLPASAEIVAPSGRFTIRDAARQCVRSVQIRETLRQEPEWITQVLAHYLPPTRSWRNRWGERVTIDEWAEFLVNRDVTRFSCGGTHLLHALAMILQAHLQCPILSRALVQRVRDVCRHYSETIEATQQPNGSWRDDWSKGGLDRKYHAVEIQAAGHILEAEMYFPEDLRIPDRCAALALKFLAQALRASTDDVVVADYCPYSHAGAVLLHCGAAAGNASGGPQVESLPC